MSKHERIESSDILQRDDIPHLTLIRLIIRDVTMLSAKKQRQLSGVTFRSIEPVKLYLIMKMRKVNKKAAVDWAVNRELSLISRN